MIDYSVRPPSEINSPSKAKPFISQIGNGAAYVAIKVGEYALRLLTSTLFVGFAAFLAVSGILTVGYLPQYLMQKVFLPATGNEEEEWSVKLPFKNAYTVQISVKEGINLDATIIPPIGKSAPLKSHPTVILFCGNAARYEYNYGLIDDYQKRAYNVACFNYRGVGMSSDVIPKSGQDLMDDGDAVFNHVKSHLHLSDDQILLRGRSLGGGVATGIAGLHPKSHLLNDRSFKSFSSAAGAIVSKVTNPLFGFIVAKAIHYTRWEIDSEKFWKNRESKQVHGKTWIISSKIDEVIPSNAQFALLRPNSPDTIETNEFGHNAPINNRVIRTIIESVAKTLNPLIMSPPLI